MNELFLITFTGDWLRPVAFTSEADARASWILSYSERNGKIDFYQKVDDLWEVSYRSSNPLIPIESIGQIIRITVYNTPTHL